VSGDGRSWFLFGASPDLRAQIEATPELHPRPSNGEIRDSPIAGAVLLNADLDHTLGLLLLRELQPLDVYATHSVHRVLSEDNAMFVMLQRVPGQLIWTDFAPEATFSLAHTTGEDSGLRCLALPLGRRYPPYVSSWRQSQLRLHEASLGLLVESPSGGRLAYMPAVPQIDDVLLKELDSSDVLLFDGTFWSDDELIRMQAGAQTAQQMGHVPVSSAEGSLRKLAQLSRPRKIYIHINNTNPMLNEAGPEYAQACEAGCEIAEDGWEFDL